MVVVVYTAKCTDAQYQQVATWLETALTNHPKSPTLLTHLAAVRRLQKDYRDVIALFRKVIDNDPNDTLTLNNLAWLLALSERNGPEALPLIQRAIALDGPQAEYLDTRAVVYLTMGDVSKAVADLKEAMAERPTAHRYFHLAQAYSLAQDRNAAMDAWQRGLRLNLDETTVDSLELAAFRRLRGELAVKAASIR
jgi:tetratricopeptide (TPR) repeat protein